MDDVLKLSYPCKCERCENPCKYGSGVLIDEDYEKLAKHLGISEVKLKSDYLEEVTKFGTTRHRPKIMRGELPYGKCIFFDEAIGCKVHSVKPLECKVAMNCKEYGEDIITWFDLKHFFNPKDKNSLREYKIYTESGGKVLKGGEFARFADDKSIREIESYDDLKESRKKDWESILGLKERKNGKK